MQRVDISLSDQLKEFVDDQVNSGHYSNVSEYVGDLIRSDERRKAQEKLETLLLEGIESGPAVEFTREDWEGIRRDGLKQVQARRTKKTA